MFVKLETMREDVYINKTHVITFSYDAYTKMTLVTFENGKQMEFVGDQTKKLLEVEHDA